MDSSKLTRFFAITPRATVILFAAVAGGMVALMQLLRLTLLPDLSPRIQTIAVLGASALLMSYRFVLPLAYAWRLRSRRSFWILTLVWIYVMTLLGLAAGSALDVRVMTPILLTLPFFFLSLLGVTLLSVPGDLVRAQWAIRQGNLAIARAYLDRATARAPDGTDGILIRANLEVQEGRPQEALELYRRAAQLDPFNASVHGGMGSVHYVEGDFAEAVQGFARAVESQPGVGVHLYNLGLAYRMVQRGWEAVDHLRRAIEFGLKPELACYAFYSSGRILEGLQVDVDVERYYKRATELATQPVVDFWKGILERSRLVHRVDLRRFLSIISGSTPEPPPAEEDVF